MSRLEPGPPGDDTRTSGGGSLLCLVRIRKGSLAQTAEARQLGGHSQFGPRQRAAQRLLPCVLQLGAITLLKAVTVWTQLNNHQTGEAMQTRMTSADSSADPVSEATVQQESLAGRLEAHQLNLPLLPQQMVPQFDSDSDDFDSDSDGFDSESSDDSDSSDSADRDSAPSRHVRHVWFPEDESGEPHPLNPDNGCGGGKYKLRNERMIYYSRRCQAMCGRLQCAPGSCGTRSCEARSFGR